MWLLRLQTGGGRLNTLHQGGPHPLQEGLPQVGPTIHCTIPARSSLNAHAQRFALSGESLILVLSPLNAELNPIRHLLALVGARHIVHVSRIRVKAFLLINPHCSKCHYQQRYISMHYILLALRPDRSIPGDDLWQGWSTYGPRGIYTLPSVA